MYIELLGKGISQILFKSYVTFKGWYEKLYNI